MDVAAKDSTDTGAPGQAAGAPAPTSTAHPGINTASDHLAAVVVARPDMDTTLTAAEVILDLADVSPPLPPLDYPATGPSTVAGVDQAIAAAIDALLEAAESSSDTLEALRAAHGARALRALQGRRADDVYPPGGYAAVQA